MIMTLPGEPLNDCDTSHDLSMIMTLPVGSV